MDEMKLITPEELGKRIETAREQFQKEQRKKGIVIKSRKAFCEGYPLHEGAKEQKEINPNTLKDWESGYRYPPMDAIEHLRQLFGYDYNTFLTVKPPKNGDVARTQATMDIVNATGLSEEGVSVVAGADPYETRFFEMLMLDTNISKMVWEYRQCYKQVQRYAYYMENHEIAQAFETVYRTYGVEVTGALKDFKRRLSALKMADLPIEEKGFAENLLNAFYSERMLAGREHDIATEIHNLIPKFIAESEDIAEREIKQADKTSTAITGKPYPKEYR